MAATVDSAMVKVTPTQDVSGHKQMRAARARPTKPRRHVESFNNSRFSPQAHGLQFMRRLAVATAKAAAAQRFLFSGASSALLRRLPRRLRRAASGAPPDDA